MSLSRSISRLTIRNLRAIREATISPAQVNLFLGATGSGKTSIRAAAEYALLRSNIFTDGRGVGIDGQVRYGAKSGSIELVMSDGQTHSAEFPKEKGGTQKAAAARYALGLTDAMVPVLIRGNNILDISDQQRRDIIIQQLKIDVAGDLISGLNTWDPDLPDLGSWLDDQTTRLEYGGKDFETFAREQRTSCNRSRLEAEKQVALLRPRVLTEDGRPTDPPAVDQAAREALEGKRDGLQEAMGQLKGLASAARAAHQQSVALWREQLRNHDTLMKQIQNSELAISDAQTSLAEAAPDGYKPSADLQAAISGLKTKGQALRAERDELATKAVLDGNGDPCPPGQCRVQIFQEVSRKLATMDAALQELRIGVQGLQNEITTAYAWEQRQANARVTVTMEQTRLEEYRRSLEEHPAPSPTEPEPPIEDNSALEDLKAQLCTVLNELAEMSIQQRERESWERDAVDWETLQVRYDDLVDESRRWDACVKALEPRGLPARIAETAVGEWMSTVSSDTHTWFGLYTRMVFAEKTWTLEASRDGNHWTLAAQLSGGERLCLSAVLQTLLAKTTGFPVVFLDEIQQADAKLRLRIVQYFLSAGVQAWLFAAAQERSHDGTWIKPTPPNIPGLKLFWVEAGQVQEIQRKESAAA